MYKEDWNVLTTLFSCVCLAIIGRCEAETNASWIEKINLTDLISTVVLAVLALLQLRVFAGQKIIMERQTIIMERQTELIRTSNILASRPWIKIIGAEVDHFQIHATKVAVNVKFSMKNIGKSVAPDVSIFAKLIIDETESVFDMQIKLYCNEVSDCYPALTLGAIFPEDIHTHNVHLVRLIDDLNDARDKFVVSASEASASLFRPVSEADVSRLKQRALRQSFTIVVCVNYAFPVSPKIHQTGFAYQLGEIAIAGSNTKVQPIDTSLAGVVEPCKLRLVDKVTGGLAT